jgi:ABC-type lipoprotein release transport system permease subunit
MAASLPATAWRNLWRQRRRTLITSSSIAFAILLSTIMTGIGDATYGEMIDLAARLGVGHVAIQNPEYQDTPTLSRNVGHAAALQQAALEDPDVHKAVRRITGNVMLASSTRSTGAGFIAFDPAVEDASTLSLLDAVVEGELFDVHGKPGIVVGVRLAEKLGGGIGRRVVLTFTDKNGDIVQEAIRITGLIETGAPTADAGLALLPLALLEKTLGYGPEETLQVAVFLDDQRRADAVAARLRGRLGDDVASLAWNEVNPELAGFIAMKMGGTLFMELLILVLVGAGIFNTIFMSVMERLREFGVLLAIGFTPRRLFGMVMWESLWLSGVGLVAGLLLTAGPYLYLNRVGIDLAALDVANAEVAGVTLGNVMRVEIYPENFLWILIAAIGATLLAGVYPAWRAGRVDPVESIRLV